MPAWLHRQLPVWSPIDAASLAAATTSVLSRRDRRPELLSLLVSRLDADGGCLTGSGAEALQLALRIAAAIRPGPALLPAFTCYEVASAAVGAEVSVALYDIDPDTLGPDWQSLERYAGQNPSSLVVAPLYGMPIDWAEARRVAARSGAVLIEDAAQAHGAAYEGRPVGSEGDLTVLSFGRGKGWTGGGGGALLWRGRVAVAARSIFEERPPEAQGAIAEASVLVKGALHWALGRPSVYGLPSSLPFLGLGDTVYSPPRAPRQMARVSAALLLGTEASAGAAVAARRGAAVEYAAALGSPAELANAGALRYPVRIAGGRGAVDALGVARLGVAGSYPKPLRELDALAERLVNREAVHPGAEALARELVTLPTHARTKPEERAEILRAVRPVAQPVGSLSAERR